MNGGVLLHGLAVPIGADEVSGVIWSALNDGTYEAKEALGIRGLVCEGDNILELGTGIGIITSLLAKSGCSHVWSFEANPSLLSIAKRVVDANGIHNVSLNQGILSAQSGESQSFFVRRDLWMSSTMEHQGEYEKEITIITQAVDDFIDGKDISLLVMDIEGGEYSILTRATLPGVQRVFVELHDHLYDLDAIGEMMTCMAAKGFAYDPRGSSGACVLFNRDRQVRQYIG